MVDPIKDGGGDSSQPMGGTAIKPVGWDRTGWEAFKYMLCDPQKGTILTRTPLSWVKIIVFYIIYYSCLATFWIVCLFVFSLTLPYDIEGPKWQMYQGLIGVTPGVGIRPRNSDALIDSQMFVLKGTTNADYAACVHRFFEKYQKKPAQPLWPPGKEDLTKNDYEERYSLREYKAFDPWTKLEDLTQDDYNYRYRFRGYKAFDPTTTLGPCGSFPYGYVGEHVKPCIYLKLNKIWGWEPRPIQCESHYQGYGYDSYECPPSLRRHLNSQAAREAGEENIWIDCNGRNAADKEALEDGITYYPASRAIPISYFPYLGERNQLEEDVGFHSPLVAIQVDPRNRWLNRGQLIHIECRAYYEGVRHDVKNKLGLVQFEVQIN